MLALEPMPETEWEHMPLRPNRHRLLWLAFSGSWMIAVGIAGCGRSSDVQEIPDAARKSLIQKKVDFEDRKSATNRNRPARSKS